MSAPPSKLTRAMRLGGHAFWNTAGFVLSLGLERLLVHPWMAAKLGDASFGAFIWVLGLVNLFGQVAANGFAIVMLRDFAGKPEADRQIMARQSLLMSIWLTVGLLGVGAIAGLSFDDGAIQELRVPLYTTLMIFAVIRSVELVLITLLRIRRQFVMIFVLRVVEGMALLGNLWAAETRSFWLIGAVYISSMVIPTLMAMWREPLIGRGQWWDRGATRGLLLGWTSGAILTLTEQGQMYAPRLLLGVVSGETAVTIFYAGVSISNLFVAPIGIVGGLVMALLAGKTAYALGGRRHRLYLIASVVAALGVGVASQFIGGWMVRWRYPQQAAATLEFYYWIAIANGFMALTQLLRPIAIRYLSMRLVNVFSAISVGLQVVALSVLTPLYDEHGAAIALAASSALASSFWVYAYYHSRDHKKLEPDAVTPGSDEG